MVTTFFYCSECVLGLLKTRVGATKTQRHFFPKETKEIWQLQYKKKIIEDTEKYNTNISTLTCIHIQHIGQRVCYILSYFYSQWELQWLAVKGERSERRLGWDKGFYTSLPWLLCWDFASLPAQVPNTVIGAERSRGGQGWEMMSDENSIMQRCWAETK